MQPVRNIVPKRTCSKTYKSYRKYKSYLQKDFHRRCGYCGDLDVLCGGMHGFQIDHFRPKSYLHFKHLENDYSNLVYACPYCNRAKSNDWPAGNSIESVLNGQGYIDPCENEYDNHLTRREDGSISPQTDVGKYMFEKLKLGLRRHQLAWKYEQLEKLIDEIMVIWDSYDKNSRYYSELSEHLISLFKEYRRYKSRFEETL